MARLSLTVDDEILKRARTRALEDGTSVNAVVREYLESYSASSRQAEARRRMVELAERSTGSSRPQGRTWTRESLYEERLGRYGRDQ